MALKSSGKIFRPLKKPSDRVSGLKNEQPLRSPEVVRELQEITLELQNLELSPQNINSLTQKLANVLVTEVKSCMKVVKISGRRKFTSLSIRANKAKGYKWYNQN